MSLICVYREPFSLEPPRVQRLPEGRSLAEIVAMMHLPEGFDEAGVVCINGHETPRGAWHIIKPKAVSGQGVPTQITFHAPIRGGGDGGKNPLATIAAIGLTILSGGAAAGLFGPAGALSVSGTLFAAQSTSALLLAGAISLVGSLLLNALIPPPSLDDASSRTQRRDASVRGNVLEPNGSVPRVVGERRLFPPLMAEPLTTFDGEDEIVEAVYGLSGPHRLQDIRIGAAPISDIPGLEIQTRDGFPGYRPQTLVQRYGRTDAVQTELRGHVVDPDNGSRLDPLLDVALAVPQTTVVATRTNPSEHELQLVLPQGLGRPAVANDLLRIPIRIRIRPLNGAWVNLPEIHYQGNDFRQLRATVKLSFIAPDDIAPTIDTTKGFVTLYTTAPGQTIAPSADGWTADSYFHDGAGDTYVWQNNLGTTGVRRYRITRGVCEFFLDPATFSADEYEIEIKRGCAVRNANWNTANYQYSSTVYDLFGYFGTPAQIPFSRSDMVDTIALARSVSIYNNPPVVGDDFAVIAVRARNVTLDRLSVLAGGYVMDWDGTGWRNWAVTSNPAPHLRDIYLGMQNADPLRTIDIDDDTLLEWRSDCITQGYECNAVLQDTTVAEAAQIVAANGFARPYQSEIYGVIRDYDRSGEAPVQVFTPRNTRSFSWSKAFPKLPDGLRVNFDDATRNYAERQIVVWREGAISNDSGRTEQITYQGATTEAEVRKRALYDLGQIELRSTFYSFETAADAIICRRGSLVALATDSIDRWTGYGRVDVGGTTKITLDTFVPVSNEPNVDDVANMDAVPNVDVLGRPALATIRRATGEVVTALLGNDTGETDVLEFVTPVSPAVKTGDLVAVGLLDREVKRLIVFSVEPRDNYEATVTLVDEAQELFA